jgi:hypothetical protein
LGENSIPVIRTRDIYYLGVLRHFVTIYWQIIGPIIEMISFIFDGLRYVSSS